jgi:amino acid permease
LGAGTITIPYVFYENGVYLGSAFLLFGGSVSFYSGYLIAYCAEKTGGHSYEEIAFKLYGKSAMRFTSVCNLLCNLGFLISYCIVFKTIMPYTIKTFGANPPDWLGDTDAGRRVWVTIYCFVLLFPCALPRNLSALRFSSFLSFGISLFIVFTIFGACFRDVKADDNLDHHFSERFAEALSAPTITVLGIFNSLPLIIFSFMYQPNIPAIYHELKKSDMFNMNKVLVIGTSIAVVAYIMAGLFGYVTFSMHPDVDKIMNAQNILKAPYGELPIIKCCLIGLLVVVLFASPFCVLPCKDSVEELLSPDKKFTNA